MNKSERRLYAKREVIFSAKLEKDETPKDHESNFWNNKTIATS